MLGSAFLAALLPVSVEASGWTLLSGDDLGGDPSAFHFEKKTLTVTYFLTGKSSEIPTKDLSLRSRQRILLSPLFYRNHPDGALSLVKGGGILPLALALAAAGSFFGFLCTAWLVTGKGNPLLALVATFGSWVVVAIFLISYHFLQLRFGPGFSAKFLGIGFSASLTPLFVAGVYGTSYLKGLLVFHSHFLVALCLVGAGLMAFEIFAGRDRADEWWTRKVLEPLGVMESAPDPFLGNPLRTIGGDL